MHIVGHLYNTLDKKLKGDTKGTFAAPKQSWACSTKVIKIGDHAIACHGTCEGTPLMLTARADGTVVVHEPEAGTYYAGNDEQLPHGIAHNRMLRMGGIPFRLASDGNEWWIEGKIGTSTAGMTGKFEYDDEYGHPTVYINPIMSDEPVPYHVECQCGVNFLTTKDETLCKDCTNDAKLEALIAEEEAIAAKNMNIEPGLDIATCSVCNEPVCKTHDGKVDHVIFGAWDHEAVLNEGMTPDQAIADGAAPPKELCCNKCDAPGIAVESVTGEWWWHHEDASTEDDHDFVIEMFDGGPKVWCANDCGTMFYSYDNSAFCPVCQHKAKKELADATAEAVKVPCDDKCGMCNQDTFVWHTSETGNSYWKCEACGYPASPAGGVCKDCGITNLDDDNWLIGGLCPKCLPSSVCQSCGDPELYEGSQCFSCYEDEIIAQEDTTIKPPHFFPGHANPLPSEAYMLEHPEKYGMATGECWGCGAALVKLDDVWVDKTGGDACGDDSVHIPVV